MARDLVIVACAISAGIHAALAPGHLAEGMAAGVAFGVSAAMLAGAAVLLVVTTGLPLLHPEPEPVEALALFTKAVEAIGLFAAAYLLLVPTPRPRGALA